MLSTRTPERTSGWRGAWGRVWRGVWRRVHGLLLASGIVLCLWMFWDYLEVYLVFFGDAPPPATAAQVTRYEWLAGTSLVSAVAGTLLALFRGRWKTLLAHTVVLAVTAVSVFLFAIPSDRWERELPANDPGPGYHPCFSGGSDDECVGG